jgi:SAM-dependent methyltransferase
MSSDYVPSRYWSDVHAAADDESAVGYPNLARSLNRARYDVERRTVRRAVLGVGIRQPSRVLDVGSGTGIWVDFWTRLGACEIIGADLTETAVERLRSRYPRQHFIRCDVSDEDPALPLEMDVVSAMSVLLHITDEARFERAMQNLMKCVASDGTLVLVEPIVVRRWWGPAFGPESNSVARPLSTYHRILEGNGFRIVRLGPAGCLLVNVVDTKRRLPFRLMQNYWHWLSRIVGKRERVGTAVGALLRPLDLLLTRLLRYGPCTKVLVAQRMTRAD